ncbi:WD repeat-containing protein SL1-17 [Schistosoma japonicum]|nr:WD repeat-containing protein SL1-17 [Schistosoma japonicum]
MINVQTAQKESSIQLEGKFVYSLAYISDGSKLAAGTINGLVSICDLETGNVQFLDGHATPVRSVSFSPDGRLLASASDDKQIKVFDVRDGRLAIPSLNGHKGWVWCARYSPQGNNIISVGDDRSIMIYQCA